MAFAWRHWSLEATSGPLMLGTGAALLALALVIYGWARRYLFDATIAHQHLEMKR